MKSTLKALVPLIFVAAAVVGVVFLQKMRRDGVPDNFEPAAIPHVSAAHDGPAQTPDPPPESPAAPGPRPAAPPSGEAAVKTLLAWSGRLQGMAYGSVVIPNVPATLDVLDKGPFAKLLALHLKEGILVDADGAAMVASWTGDLEPALRKAAGETAALGIYFIRLPGDRAAPVVAAVPQPGRDAALGALKEFLEKIEPGAWHADGPGSDSIMLFGAPEGIEKLRMLEYAASDTADLAAPRAVANIDSSLFPLAARILQKPWLARYSAGLMSISGTVTPTATGFDESWELRFQPGDHWPLMMFGGPVGGIEGLGKLPGTSIAAAGGFAEVDSMLPVAEKYLSRYLPGVRLGDMAEKGLNGTGFLAVASPKATWQPTYYGLLEPRGGNEAIAAFQDKYVQVLQQMNLREGTSTVAGSTVHYPLSPPGNTINLLAALVPSWAHVGHDFYAGMSPLGLKEMLTGGRLSQEKFYAALRGELPPEASGILLVDMERLAYLAYERYSRLAANRARLRYGTVVSTELLPTPDRVMECMRPFLAYTTSSRSRMTLQGNTPIPLAVLAAAGVFLVP
ncbi:MAG: hypothetical protein JW909_09325 [Planctomycetes bacterium]|nr:hypothetical protein [Planctomycetota bacterium]